jgi:hypothetical protein
VLKITQLFLLIILFFAVTQSGQASVLIEPLVGYNFSSKAEIDDKDNQNSYSGGGGAVGGRLGYQKLGFQLGVDYLRSSIDFDDKDFDKNVTMNEWGGFVGFEFPVLLRIYAGYVFSATGTSKFKDQDGEIQDFDLKSGSATKFGIGFTGLPFLVINLEYRAGAVDEYKIGDTKYEDEKFTYSSYLISLSLPINL